MLQVRRAAVLLCTRRSLAKDRRRLIALWRIRVSTSDRLHVRNYKLLAYCAIRLIQSSYRDRSLTRRILVQTGGLTTFNYSIKETASVLKWSHPPLTGERCAQLQSKNYASGSTSIHGSFQAPNLQYSTYSMPSKPVEGKGATVNLPVDY